MKYDSRKAFPYPVLPDDRDYNDDYVNRDFQAAIDFKPDANGGDIILTANFMINEDAILNRIGNGANYAVHVLCPKTNYRRMIRTHETRLSYAFKKRELHGKVILMGCVVCTDGIAEYHSPNFHPEFGGKSFGLSRGSVLAIAAPEIFYVDAAPAKPVAAVIKLVKQNRIPKGEFDYNIEGDYICVLMGESHYDSFNAGRRDPETVPFLLMSVYYPVLMDVLRIMHSDDNGMYDEKKWYRAIDKRMEELGMELKDDQFHIIAQRLLGRPLEQLPLVDMGGGQ